MCECNEALAPTCSMESCSIVNDMALELPLANNFGFQQQAGNCIDAALLLSNTANLLTISGSYSGCQKKGAM